MGRDTVRKIDYWYTTVPDQPGTASQVLKKLADAKVNLLAFLAFPIPGGKSQLDLMPVDAASFEKAAAGAGVSLSPKRQALLVMGADRPGALAEHTAKLAAKGVNLTASTAVATTGGGYGTILWVSPQSLDAAARALGA